MEYVILEHNLDNLLLPERKDYREFIYCKEGSCSFICNEAPFTLKKGCCAVIITRFLRNVEVSEDFDCDIIYIDSNFLRRSEPNSSYIIQATLELSMSPIIEPEEKDQELCRLLFYNFGLRIADKKHKFYKEILSVSTRMLTLDLFNLHANTKKNENMSRSGADIMSRFIKMLQDKEYRNNREVAYYAAKLNVVPKYLSEICNKTSGFSASYWINRFTSFDINQLLHEGNMTPNEISKMFKFSSTSYFNRYVKRYLGVFPNELRKQ